jgi:hypothetical protein
MIAMITRLVLIVSATCVATGAGAADVNVREHIATQRLFLEHYDVLFRPDIATIDLFTKAVYKVPVPRRVAALDFITAHDAQVSRQFLMAMVHWHFIEPNEEKLNRAIQLQTRYEALVHSLNQVRLHRRYVAGNPTKEKLRTHEYSYHRAPWMDTWFE